MPNLPSHPALAHQHGEHCCIHHIAAQQAPQVSSLDEPPPHQVYLPSHPDPFPDWQLPGPNDIGSQPRYELGPSTVATVQQAPEQSDWLEELLRSGDPPVVLESLASSKLAERSIS